MTVRKSILFFENINKKKKFSPNVNVVSICSYNLVGKSMSFSEVESNFSYIYISKKVVFPPPVSIFGVKT